MERSPPQGADGFRARSASVARAIDCKMPQPNKQRKMEQELLARVLLAQDDTMSGYATALREIRAGHKQTCWIWWIWPTLAGVRETSKPEFYVPDAEAALKWIRHPKLGPRFVDITRQAVSHLDAGVSPLRLFGWQADVDKFHESVTLFGEVTRCSYPDQIRLEVVSLCNRALKALQLPPHQKTLEVLQRTGESFRPQLDPHSFDRSMSNSQLAPTPPSTEFAAFLAALGLAAHTAVMRADGFDSIAALGTMDSDDATEMRSALAARGVPGVDVDRILDAAAAWVHTPQAENAPRMRPVLQAAGSGAVTGTPVQPQPPPMSQAASVIAVARVTDDSRLLSQQPHPTRGAGGAPALEVAAAFDGSTRAAGEASGGGGSMRSHTGPPAQAFQPPQAQVAAARTPATVSRFATTTVRLWDNDADVAQQADNCLRRMNEATLADPATAESLKPLCTVDAPVRDGEAIRGWSCVRMASVALPAPLAPRLLALDVEMIERRADGVRLPVSAALICYDLSPRQPKRVLFSGLVDPSGFDPEWLSGPMAYDYKERWVGLDYMALRAARERGEMTPVRDLQHLVQEHMHSATYLVGHALSGDLKVLRLHGPELEARVVDTQALYPLPAGVGHARLKALVEDMLPAEAWRHFQAVGAAHPPDQDANAALELVTRELELLLEQPQRRIGVWSSSDGSGGNRGGCSKRPITANDSRAIRTLLVAESDVGRLIGKKGSKIEQLRADSGAQLELLSLAESHTRGGGTDDTKRVLRIEAPDWVTLDRACALIHASVLVPPVVAGMDHLTQTPADDVAAVVQGSARYEEDRVSTSVRSCGPSRAKTL